MKHLLAKLQFETFIFDLAAYTQAPVIEGYQSVFEDELTLAVSGTKQGVNHLFGQLSQQGIKVLSMRNKSNRLEELFLKITEIRTKGRINMFSLYFTALKSLAVKKPTVIYEFGSNTGTASDYDVLIFCDFWENDWRELAIWAVFLICDLSCQV